jgi:hypothetical protein
MKTAIIITTLASLAFATGCAGNVQGNASAKAPQQTAKAQEPVVVLPYDMGPGGEMSVSWQPAAPPPVKKAKARKIVAKPHFVSGKRNKGRLFLLPTKFEH